MISSLIDPKHLDLELRGRTSAEAVWEIVERLRDSGALRSAKEFFEAVLKREEKSSTVANGGVAFPHARTNLVDQIILGIGRSAKGVRFGAEGKLVHLIFVIAVPQQMVNDYLICVGSLARVLNRAETRAALLGAATSAEFLAQLREGP